VIDFRRCGSSRQLSEIYQDFGLRCARREVRYALLKTGDEEGDAHYALRDILRAVALVAGIPVHLRLALVASSDSVAQVCQTMQQDLRALGCDARLFRMERQADQWLRAGKVRVGVRAGKVRAGKDRRRRRSAKLPSCS